MTLGNRVRLVRDTNGTIRVDFPDVPEAHTFGEDRKEALARAVDALETALMAYMEDRRDIPVSRRSEGNRGLMVRLPALSTAKVALYQQMRAKGIRKAELARRLGWHAPQVERLLDLRHASRLDQLERALEVAGLRLVVSVEEAA